MSNDDVNARTTTLRAAAGYLEQWVRTQVTLSRVPGVQVAVRSGGELVLDLAVGVADVSTGEPLRTDHLFRIASHSKTFTATALMQLREAGRIRLDDPLSQHVPELDGTPVGSASIREVLGHQAGVIRDGEHADFWQLAYPFPDRAALITEATQRGRVFDRNEHFKYSNIGYGLLGLVIEAASGKTYGEYVDEHIVAPLGLTRTGAEYVPARAAEYAAGHTGLLPGELERLPIEHVDTQALAAATGFYSTAAELSAYGAAHVPGDDRLISDDSKRIMQRLESIVSHDGTELGRYGVGMELRTVGERQLVGHSGGYPGHITRTFVDPKDNLVVSVLTNAVDGPASPIAVGLLALIDAALAPSTAPAPPADAPDPASFEGRFAALWGAEDIALLGDRLVLVRPTEADPRLSIEELEIVDSLHLRLPARPSFGPSGEVVHLTRSDEGLVTSVRVGGMTAWPIEDFLARRPAMTQVARPRVAP
ncbi:beta-lactamase family protein [Actinotalea sp. M2MS4P-6]|uniref:serine hydrolase domain-containing protein n=1 Tax=Actinotalea sp. M2MS4P-6 TaxID=2983762 RepID=UPI0021E43EB4|nr:serine hydrolase domain-containing protein [Actinotalea sp. M2MS4P-6]MCV2395326.1 beta-lactamase family protein [Actinotalea sp. M2MS4P-6]